MSPDDAMRMQEEIGRLRRNLAQQLTETGDIVGAIREIDEVLYGGQYFAPDEDDIEDDFFADIRRARVLLTSLGNDLRHYQGLLAHLDHEEGRDTEINRLSDWESRLTELDRQLQEARQEAEQAQAAREQSRRLESDLREMEERLRSSTAADEGLHADLSQARSQLEDLQGQLGSVNWERDSLREQLQHQEEEQRSLRDAIQEANQGRDAVQAQKEAAEAELAEAREALAAAIQERDELRNGSQSALDAEVKLAEQTARITSLERDIAEQQEELKQLAKDLETQRERRQQSEESLSVAIAERDRLRHELALGQARHEEELSKVERRHQTSSDESSAHSQREVLSLKQQLQEMSKREKAAVKDLEAVQAEFEHLKASGPDPAQSSDLRWQLENERTRHQEERKSWERRDGEMRKLLEAARSVVLQAKEERKQGEAVARSMIEDLQRQLAERG
ncbi:MAG: hypothetical protein EA402_12350 [Planctomycetota bacterium]|nr:MAG: hypothetical protein EA402_12350 [Planctomycetota bacterium]